MKRLICILLIAMLCLQLFACSQENDKIRKPVNFYYRNSEISYGSDRGVISPQIVESDGIDDPLDLLNKYLRGATDTAHVATFPASTKVLEMTENDGNIHLKMNNSLARLSGMELTIACACITLTVMELTGASSVTIQASNETLDGSDTITMSMDNLILLNLYVPETQQE